MTNPSPACRAGGWIAALGALSALAACQSMPTERSGYLSSYEGLGDARNGATGPSKRRDDAASDAVARIYIEPTVLRINAMASVKAAEQAMVRREIDRQLCYKLSRRFDISPEPDPDAARVRAAVVHIAPTSPTGSAATAAASYFIPVPMLKIRPPRISGGLVAEAELVSPSGQQVAAIAWARSTEGLSTIDPSLSPVGDALQLSEKFAGAVDSAFATKARKKRAVASPDPCARFGPRRTAARTVGGAVLGFGTGLYSPSVSGAGRPPEDRPANR